MFDFRECFILFLFAQAIDIKFATLHHGRDVPACFH